MLPKMDIEQIKDLILFCKKHGIAKISIPQSFEAIIPIIETKDVMASLPDIGVSDKPNPNFNPQDDEDILFYSVRNS